MKSSGLRVLAVIVFLLAFAGANVGSFLLGGLRRSTIPFPGRRLPCSTPRL